MVPKRSAKRGFTLIELLVVIAIIGMLATIVLSSMNTARAKSRDARRQADIAQIRNALEFYYSDHNQYPPSGGATTPVGWSNSNDTSWTTLEAALAPYIAKLPTDPRQSASGWAANAGTYTYTYYSMGYGCPQQWYMIVWRSEAANIPSPGVTPCTGATFNYSIAYPGTVTVGVGK